MSKISKINTAIKIASSKLSGPLGIGFKDLLTGETCYYNGRKPFPTASVFKVFVLAELYNKVYKGEVSLSDRIALSKDMKSPGSGILFQMDCDTKYTFYDYALLMMILSDNTAADFLYNYVGAENIYRNVIVPLKLSNTRVDLSYRDLFQYYCHADPTTSPEEQLHIYYTGNFLHNEYYKCTQTKNDITTPMDMNRILEIFYTGKWCNADISSQILNVMKKCQTNSRIPKYLPAGTVVAHKTGTFDRLVNDCGIVYTDAGDYILSMFYNGNMADENEYINLNQHGYWGDETLAHLSKEIYHIYTSKCDSRFCGNLL